MFNQNRACMGKEEEGFIPYDEMNSQGASMQMGGVKYPQSVLPGMECEPVCEPPCENIVHRQINHHVRHVQPIHTRIINNHIYHHSYVPCYTCCEENICCNVYNPNPCCK
ncbi:MAG: hypothetical protein PHH51_00145 [Bacilli bacterium]|nr:hypothetical protein [Bacilli bacterium]MDD3895531.1 hypothetical protein [Bacilli bacterium]MDD4407984.1 hypothetical protein [Bacilli bacterium]